MAEKNALDWIALILVIVGGLNWGLVGLFQFDLVKAILGSIPLLQNAVYVLNDFFFFYYKFFFINWTWENEKYLNKNCCRIDLYRNGIC
jgi:uncharacterized membrane protein YuzA (DUF378 family)